MSFHSGRISLILVDQSSLSPLARMVLFSTSIPTESMAKSFEFEPIPNKLYDATHQHTWHQGSAAVDTNVLGHGVAPGVRDSEAE